MTAQTTGKWYQNISPQLKELFDALEKADRIARDIACGEWESLSDEGIMSVADEANRAGDKWIVEVLGDPSSGDIIIEGPMSTLSMARDRLEEDARPRTRSEWRAIHAEDRMDDLRAREGA